MTYCDVREPYTGSIIGRIYRGHSLHFIIHKGTKVYTPKNMDNFGYRKEIRDLISQGIVDSKTGEFKRALQFNNIESALKSFILDKDYLKYKDGITWVDEEAEDSSILDTKESSETIEKPIEIEEENDNTNKGTENAESIESKTNGDKSTNYNIEDIPSDVLLSALLNREANRQKTVKLDPDDMAQIERVVSQGREISIPDKEINKIKEMFNKQPKEAEQEYQWSKQSVTFKDRQIIGYSDILDKINELLDTNKHALLIEGVPGTGKTLILNKYLEHVKNSDTSNILFVSFHQNYSYNEFIGGYTADIEGGFSYKDGVFTRFCQKADSNRDQKYYCFIDEISRGNVEAIFGEIMTALTFRDRIITLGCGRQFMIPSNVYIVASRNITDKSTKDMDIATLQRFERLLIKPQWTDEYIDNVLRNKEDADCKELLRMICEIMTNINEEILKDSDLGSHYQIGTRALDLSQISFESIKNKIKNDLIPSIEENIKGSFDIEDKIDKYLKDLEELGQ